MLSQSISNGSAFETFKKFIVAQGGEEDEVLNPELLAKANYIEEVVCDHNGWVSKIHTEEIGRISLLLGGGRETKESVIDLSVGLILHKKHGDYVNEGEALATIHANDPDKLEAAKERLLKAYELSVSKVQKQPVIKAIIQ